MLPQDGTREAAIALLGKCDLELVSFELLQTLWAGYGHVCALKASPSSKSRTQYIPLILKYVCPPKRRLSKDRDEGHHRKVISYQVEQHFYAHLAPLMPKEIAVAVRLDSIDSHNISGDVVAMILTDLRERFPVAGEKRGELSENQVYAAIEWLARFHGFWWPRDDMIVRQTLRLPPLEEAQMILDGRASAGGVWLNGGYTYLTTRKTEYANLASDEESEWSKRLCVPLTLGKATVAEQVAQFLSPRLDGSKSAIATYETLIHGDVKSENLFTTEDGNAVAFFDFQYVGLGLGVCDLAKLFTCSVPLEMLQSDVGDGSMQAGEESLLRAYMSRLNEASGRRYEWDVLRRHWEIALVDWLRFQASWGFWGNTDWLEARVRNILEDEDWRIWLDNNLQDPGVDEARM